MNKIWKMGCLVTGLIALLVGVEVVVVAKDTAGNTGEDVSNADFEIIQQVDPLPLISGVNSICALGVPGPLFALNTTAVPVVSGDNDTTPIPSVVVMVSGLGSGRVVALGHEGFLTNEALELFDNKRFGNNIVDWLDNLGKRKILVTTGHGEWYGGSNFDNFKAELESRGYEVVRFSGTITPSVLSDVGIVLIGNAWGNVSDSEIDALTNFVSNGGGLLLIGLGWSYKGYVGPLDEYPMNKIAEPYGIRWIDGYIIDPTDDYEGGVIFHTFYPNIEVQTIYQAFSYIENTTDAHPSDLPSFLQTNKTARRKYTNAHLLIATATRELNQLSPQRQEIYDFYKGLINTYPQYFRKEVVYDKATESTMAWIRERVYRSFIDALPLTDARKSEIASTIGLYDQYLDIWTDFTVLLLDNTCLNEKQKDFIYTYLNLLPGGIHNLRSISVTDYLGHTSPEVPLWGLEGGVNIFGVDIGEYSENSFPDDVPPGIVDGFCIVVAHEINHVVDAFYIQNNNTLRDRRDELIANAGDEHLNYLRSMFPDGFFADNPQEFFASIANQWFTDSKKTIELGIVRFDKGFTQPINQALFFADVYSLGRNFTYFYTIDTQGNITRHKIPLSRDENGRINSLTIGDLVYTFTLDANGDVTAYSIQPFDIKISNIDHLKTVSVNQTFEIAVTFNYNFPSPNDAMIQVYEHAGPLLAQKIEKLSGAGSKTYNFTLTAPSTPKIWQLNIHAFYRGTGPGGWNQTDIKTIYINISSKISTVLFNPSQINIPLNSTNTINITLDSAPNGLSGYNISISLCNGSVAEITSIKFPAWATLHSNSSLPADSLWIKAADLNDKIKSGAKNITLVTITLRGDKQGESDILITVTKMDDDNGNPIDPNTVSGKIEVVGVIPFPGCENLPTDPDRDGLYEDINGNGRKDFNDVVVFFNYLEWVERNQPCIECFDFNKNGRIDFDDVVKLFEEI